MPLSSFCRDEPPGPDVVEPDGVHGIGRRPERGRGPDFAKDGLLAGEELVRHDPKSKQTLRGPPFAFGSSSNQLTKQMYSAFLSRSTFGSEDHASLWP